MLILERVVDTKQLGDVGSAGVEDGEAHGVIEGELLLFLLLVLVLLVPLLGVVRNGESGRRKRGSDMERTERKLDGSRRRGMVIDGALLGHGSADESGLVHDLAEGDMLLLSGLRRRLGGGRMGVALHIDS